MPVKALVFAEVPSSTRLKFESGAGLAVKPKDVEPSGVACFTMVMEPGKMTASSLRERSWLPPDPFRSSRREWYGEPVIAIAELFWPQSWREAMWPPQASTGFATFDVNVIVMLALLSPLKPAPFE